MPIAISDSMGARIPTPWNLQISIKPVLVSNANSEIRDESKDLFTPHSIYFQLNSIPSAHHAFFSYCRQLAVHYCSRVCHSLRSKPPVDLSVSSLTKVSFCNRRDLITPILHTFLHISTLPHRHLYILPQPQRLSFMLPRQPLP